MNDLKPAHEQLIDWKDWYLPASSVFHGEVLHSYDQVLSEAEFSARFHELPSILDRLLEEAIELKVEFDPIIQYQSIWSTLPPLKATNSPEHDSIFDSVLMLANKMRILKSRGIGSTFQATLQEKKSKKKNPLEYVFCLQHPEEEICELAKVLNKRRDQTKTDCIQIFLRCSKEDAIKKRDRMDQYEKRKRLADDG
ncbi:hypothetical protein N9093_00715 [bacterium]|nr:hypothetical protein [bacterium]